MCVSHSEIQALLVSDSCASKFVVRIMQLKFEFAVDLATSTILQQVTGYLIMSSCSIARQRLGCQT